MGELFKALSEKHLMRTGVVYLGCAWLMLEATGFFVDNYALSRRLIDIVVMLLVLGFPAALIIAWFHGAKGRQNVARSEASLLLTLAVLAGIGTYRISTAEMVPEQGSGAPAAMSAICCSVSATFHIRTLSRLPSKRVVPVRLSRPK